MLFFDDENRNIQTVLAFKIEFCIATTVLFGVDNNLILKAYYIQVSKMGVTSILVRKGVNLGAFRQGLKEFSQNSISSVSKPEK